MENEHYSETPFYEDPDEQEGSSESVAKDYEPFPPFEKWANCTLDMVRWDRYKDQLEQYKQAPPMQFERAQAIVKRVAAIETGVIEDLYPGDKSFTITAASEVIVWEAALRAKDPLTQTLIESQLEAYDHVMGFAKDEQPIAEAWLRHLHAVICKGQGTYRVWTPSGFQDQVLQLGAYKSQPNHIRRPDGQLISCAPVSDTASEMNRLCAELRSEPFLAAHPALQSSYAHYALVTIHPFPDGNGRVARALASVFTYKAISVPLLIVEDNGREYRNALTLADQCEYQPFVDFVLERTFDAIRLVEESLRTARVPSLKEAIGNIEGLYRTKGGYTHDEVDRAGHQFFSLFQRELDRQLKDFEAHDKIKFSIARKELNAGKEQRARQMARRRHRWTVVDGQPVLNVRIVTSDPASASAIYRFVVEVPHDSGLEDDLTIYELTDPNMSIEARISELHPRPATVLEMRLRMSVERVAGQMVQALMASARQALRKRGY